MARADRVTDTVGVSRRRSRASRSSHGGRGHEAGQNRRKSRGTEVFQPRRFSTSRFFRRVARVGAQSGSAVVPQAAMNRVAVCSQAVTRFDFPRRESFMKRFPSIVMMGAVLLIVGFLAADSASAAGRGRRGRTSCDCGPSCAAEPACAAAEPSCGASAGCAAAEPACCAAEPACCATATNCCEPRRRGRARGARMSRRGNDCCSGASTSCCAEPGCAAEPACGAEPCCNAG